MLRRKKTSVPCAALGRIRATENLPGTYREESGLLLSPLLDGMSTSFQRSAVPLKSNSVGMFCPFLILAGAIHCCQNAFACELRAFMRIIQVQGTLAQKMYQNKVEDVNCYPAEKKQHYWHEKTYFKRWSDISFPAYLNAISFFVSRDHAEF